MDLFMFLARAFWEGFHCFCCCCLAHLFRRCVTRTGMKKSTTCGLRFSRCVFFYCLTISFGISFALATFGLPLVPTVLAVVTIAKAVPALDAVHPLTLLLELFLPLRSML